MPREDGVTSASIELKPDQTCEACGKFGAYAFDGATLCPECLQARGSCCTEFDVEVSERKLKTQKLTQASRAYARVAKADLSNRICRPPDRTEFHRVLVANQGTEPNLSS